VTEVGKASFDVVAFLRETGRSAQVASLSAQAPLLGSLWYLFNDGKFWFSSSRSSALPRAAERGFELAVIVDDFNPPLSIRQVRVRGHGGIEPHDPDVVRRIYERYLGLALDDWPQFFRERLDQLTVGRCGPSRPKLGWQSLHQPSSKRSTAGTPQMARRLPKRQASVIPVARSDNTRWSLRPFVFVVQLAHCAVHSPASWPVMTLRRFQVLIAAIQTTKAARAFSS
jgi:hypothetical protein